MPSLQLKVIPISSGSNYYWSLHDAQQLSAGSENRDSDNTHGAF